MGLETTGVTEESMAKATLTPELALSLLASSTRVITWKVLLIQILVDALFSQGDPLREEFILSLYI